MRLTILHFNDLHGRLEQMPRLFTLMQRERAEAQRAGRRVLVLDGGDSSDRGRWESDVTKGRANYSLLEAMGVDATVVGNGEALQWGRTALDRLVGAVHFPVLAANLVDLFDPEKPAVPGLRRTALVDLDGFRLGLTGVTQVYPGGYDRFGYASTEPEAALRGAVAALRAEGVKQIVLLSHLGLPMPPETKAEWPDPGVTTDDDVARGFPEIGVIVGGHSHTTLERPLVIGKTVIVQAGDYGRTLGRLDVDLDDESGAVTAHAGWLIACGAEVPSDPTILGTLELVREEADRLLDTPLGAATTDLPHAFDRPSAFAGRVADALRAVCGADLAIFYAGFAQQGLKAGPITRRDLFQALPGSAHVTAAVVSGAQIRRMVERMLASPYRTESFNPKRNAPPLGLPATSANVRLDYDVDPPRLRACTIDGVALATEARYRLASTYYTLSEITNDPEYDYVGLEAGQRVEMVRVEAVLWEVVADYVRQRGGL
jgi:2',3'-cyclic-nucleotide 2'-phosphodiesterase (5'-nucleotidase family)